MKPVPADDIAIDRAVVLLRKGGLVAFPTETVYGLGADASNPDAVRRIFTAKGRPADHPLIVHLADKEQLSDWALQVPEMAKILATRFWPGPLAMILNKKAEVPFVVTGGQPTVGLRVPDHAVALRLLRKFGGGIAAPSANRFCRISPTEARHVEEELGDDVDLILDGGSCQVGVESTIIDLSGRQPRLLRPGRITIHEIEDCLQTHVVLPSRPAQSGIRAPGMMELHYAPITPAFLCSSERIVDTGRLWTDQGRRIGLMWYRQQVPASSQIYPIRMPEQADAYAQRLYRTMRDLDHLGLDAILVERPPEGDAWQAINDRLRKAAKVL
ncbi:MAG: L-threonylcarbamoyladenylate synthase [Gammaproteobacteria bacterium]